MAVSSTAPGAVPSGCRPTSFYGATLGTVGGWYELGRLFGRCGGDQRVNMMAGTHLPEGTNG